MACIHSFWSVQVSVFLFLLELPFSLRTPLGIFFVALYVVVFFLLMTVFLCCLQDIFMFITRQLKGLEDTKSAQFNRYFYLLEVCEFESPFLNLNP